ncbi:MAG: hypothetical protein ACXWNK_13985 [Vulcanimicrobiaceae bacterium]
MALLAAAAVVLIHSCTYWQIPRKGNPLKTIGVRISYENVSKEPLTGVRFLINTRGNIEYVTDQGSFAPFVNVEHQFYTLYFPYYEAKTTPDACRVASVRFAKGDWQNVSP